MASIEETESPGLSVPFEQAIERVEVIVAQMENERLPLEELIRSYQEGTALLEICRRRIDEAQNQVEVISRRANGTWAVEPLDEEQIPDAESGSTRSQQRLS